MNEMVSTGEDLMNLRLSEGAVLLQEKAERLRELANLKDGFTKTEKFLTLDLTALDDEIKTIKADLAEIVAKLP